MDSVRVAVRRPQNVWCSLASTSSFSLTSPSSSLARRNVKDIRRLFKSHRPPQRHTLTTSFSLTATHCCPDCCAKHQQILSLVQTLAKKKNANFFLLRLAASPNSRRFCRLSLRSFFSGTSSPAATMVAAFAAAFTAAAAKLWGFIAQRALSLTTTTTTDAAAAAAPGSPAAPSLGRSA